MDNQIFYIVCLLVTIFLLIYFNFSWFHSIFQRDYHQSGGQFKNGTNTRQSFNDARESFSSELLADYDSYFQVKNHEIVYLQNLRKLRDEKLNTLETQKEKAQNLIREHQELIKLIPNAPIQPLYTERNLTEKDDAIAKIQQFYATLINDYLSLHQFNIQLLISILYLEKDITDSQRNTYQQQKNNFDLLAKQFNLL